MLFLRAKDNFKETGCKSVKTFIVLTLLFFAHSDLSELSFACARQGLYALNRAHLGVYCKGVNRVKILNFKAPDSRLDETWKLLRLHTLFRVLQLSTGPLQQCGETSVLR